MELYGQNFCRRMINMYRRTDSLSYFKKLKPFCEPVKKMLTKEDVEKLQSIKIPEGKDLSVLSRNNTTTHQCCEKFSENEKAIITDISEKVRQAYEKEIGKKLFKKSKMYGYAVFGITTGTQGFLFDSSYETVKKLSIPQTNISKFLKSDFSLSYYKSLSLKDKYRVLDIIYEPNGYTIIGFTRKAYEKLSNERLKKNFIKVK